MSVGETPTPTHSGGDKTHANGETKFDINYEPCQAIT